MMEEEQIKELFLEQAQIDESLWHRELTFDELALDSLQLLELVVGLEQAFDIQLDDQRLARCETVGEALDFVLARIRGEI